VFGDFVITPCFLFVKYEVIDLLAFALDPRFAISNLAKDDGFLRVIKICGMTSFGGEVKPPVPCCKFL
jgi:hypothetical protein